MTSISIRIIPTQTCALCCHRLIIPKETLVLVPLSQRIFHERCVLSAFPLTSYPSGMFSENLGKRVLDIRATTQIKRWVYIVAMAVCVLAFGVFSQVPRIIVTAVSSSVSAYLIGKGIDRYVYKQAIRVVQFG